MKRSRFRSAPSSRFPRIKKEEVDRIIGLTKLEAVKNNWVNRAVDCISKCVEIDPHKRPAAEDLLRHPFLF